MPTHVVILGAGFGGLELSTRLSEGLADEVRVTLIDKRDSLVLGFSKLDVMVTSTRPTSSSWRWLKGGAPAATYQGEAVC